MVFVKNNIIVSRLTEYEPKEIECICTKVTIAENTGSYFQYTGLPDQEILSPSYCTTSNSREIKK